MASTMAPAYPHDPIEELYPDVFWVQGSIRMGPGMTMNRNMLILRSGAELILINPVRLSDEGLAALDALGIVQHVLRLGDFHGLDDAFYIERYQCHFWAQAGQSSYPEPKPTHIIDTESVTPVEGAEFFIFESARFPEAALVIKKHGLLITTDSVQYHSDWRYFSRFTKFVFKLLGFKLGLNIGPPWLKRVTPKGGSLKGDFERLLQQDFDVLVAAHGSPLKQGAKNALRAELETVFK